MKLRAISLFVLLLLASSLSLSRADEDDVCGSNDLSNTPVLAEGRVMPLGLYAEKMRRSVFSGDRCAAAPAAALYCYLSLGKKSVAEQRYGCKLQLKAEHAATFELLGLPGRTSPISPELALANRARLMGQYHLLERKGEGSSGPGSDLGALLTRLDKYANIVAAADWLVLGPKHDWIKAAELRASMTDVLTIAAVQKSASYLTAEEVILMERETLYEKSHPFAIATLFCLLGFVFSLGAPRSRQLNVAAWVAMGALAATETFGIALRVMVSGRAPVTNMFETVMWVGFGVLVLSFIIGLKLRSKAVWAAGFAGNTISLFMLNFATSMLDGNIQPLVPVLRDNFWLSTHVTAVTSSYACFAFSWLLANYVLARRLLGKRSAEFLETWNYVIRIGMQIGSVFLAAGVILGGVWADYSWGRFWGWDPKETWSLIALIIYMGILHGRYVGWFRGSRFTVMAAAAFLSIIMAWFGVNYILAVGLHSYGFSSGGAAFIATITMAQLVVIALTLLREQRRPRAAH